MIILGSWPAGNVCCIVSSSIYCSTKISIRLPSSRSCKSSRRPVLPLSIACMTFWIVPSFSWGAIRFNRCSVMLIRLMGIVGVTFIFLLLVTMSVIQIRTVRFRTRSRGCSCSDSSASNSCAACAAVIWPDSTMFRIRLRSSVVVVILLTLQQTHCFLDVDLFSSETVEYHTAIGTTVALISAAECSYNFIEPAPGRFIGNIQVFRTFLAIAPVLDKQLDKIKLFAGQASNPAQAELPLDDNTTLGTLQPGDNQLVASQRVPGDEWMHTMFLLLIYEKLVVGFSQEAGAAWSSSQATQASPHRSIPLPPLRGQATPACTYTL